MRMAKPGDIVEFRSGTWGIQAPRNLAILLERKRRKGTTWVRILTEQGAREAKAEQLTRRVFSDRYPGSVEDLETAAARLRDMLERHAGGQLAERPEDDLGALEEALWEASCDAGRDDWSALELAQAHYGPDASRLQRQQVQEALEGCRRPGTGRFETVGGHGDRWRPWSRAERARMEEAWSALARLQGKLLAPRVAPASSASGSLARPGQHPDVPGSQGAIAGGGGDGDDASPWRRVPVAEAGLDAGDRATLEWVARAMAQYVEHDGVPSRDVQGIGGLAAVQAFGYDLHRRLGFLAHDWIEGEGTSRSSDYVHFLMQSGMWDPEDAVAALMRRHVNQERFFQHVPDERAEGLARDLPEPAWDAEDAQREGRQDLRHLECWTIDPADAKDFDDAVGVEDIPGQTGWTRLWVHIADVSHYVALDGTLDRHARDRATSVYLPGRVLPMLPARIADHLCSLRHDGDRFALSVAMDVDAGGDVQSARATPAMIRVRRNLTYADALRLRDDGDARFARLFALAAAMHSRRRGLEIDTGEVRVILEEQGFGATEKRADDATRMIEAFMVAANEAVARILNAEDVPGLFRCHPLPDPAATERFTHQMDAMGLRVEMELPNKEGTRSQEGQSLLDHLKAQGGKMQLFGGGPGGAHPQAAGQGPGCALPCFRPFRRPDAAGGTPQAGRAG